MAKKRKRQSPKRANGQRNYLAGNLYDRFTSDWVTSDLNEDALARGIETVRKRSWQLWRENPYVIKICADLQANIFNAEDMECGGFHFENKGTTVAGRVEDEKANRQIEDGWKQLCAEGNIASSFSNRQSVYDQNVQALNHIFNDGDALIQLYRGFPNDQQFACGLISGQRIPSHFNDSDRQDGTEIVNGVHVGQFGQHLGYFVGEKDSEFWGHYESRPPKFVSATSAIFPFQQRCIAHRGTPWLAAAMLSLRHLSKYEEAEVIAARIQACQMGFFTGGDPTDYVGDEIDAQGRSNIKTEPGTFRDSPNGKDFAQFKPEHPNGNYPEFRKAMLRGIAASFPTPYCTISQDLEGVNFSSIRQGILEARELYKVLQALFVRRVEIPRYEAWLEWMLISGRIKGADIGDFRRLNKPCFLGRRWDWVDPLKDLQAAKLERELVLTSPRRQAAMAGADFKTMVAEAEEDIKMLKQADLFIEEKPPVAQPTKPKDDEEDGDS